MKQWPRFVQEQAGSSDRHWSDSWLTAVCATELAFHSITDGRVLALDQMITGLEISNRLKKCIAWHAQIEYEVEVSGMLNELFLQSLLI